jgi:hypothetical protein
MHGACNQDDQRKYPEAIAPGAVKKMHSSQYGLVQAKRTMQHKKL